MKNHSSKLRLQNKGRWCFGFQIGHLLRQWVDSLPLPVRTGKKWIGERKENRKHNSEATAPSIWHDKAVPSSLWLKETLTWASRLPYTAQESHLLGKENGISRLGSAPIWQPLMEMKEVKFGPNTALILGWMHRPIPWDSQPLGNCHFNGQLPFTTQAAD